MSCDDPENLEPLPIDPTKTVEARLPGPKFTPGTMIDIEGWAFCVHKITKKNLVLRFVGRRKKEKT